MGKRIFITKKMVFIVNIQFPFLKMITILKSIILTLEFLIQKADFHHNLNIFHKTGIFLLTHPEVRLFYFLSLSCISSLFDSVFLYLFLYSILGLFHRPLTLRKSASSCAEGFDGKKQGSSNQKTQNRNV